MNPAAASLRRASEHIRRGDLAGARREAELALAADPQSGPANHFLGILNCRAGDYRAGIRHLSRAIEVDPRDIASRINLARALIDSGDLGQAEAVSGVEVPPGAAGVELLRLRGFILQEIGEAAGAIACYESVVRESPGDWEIWNNLGNARRAAGDALGAVAALEAASRLRPDLPAVAFNLGLGLAAAGRFGEAAESFRRVVAAEPRNMAARIELGRALDRAGAADRALTSFAEASALAPEDPVPHLEAGMVSLRLGDYDDAEEAFRRSIGVEPAFTPAFLQLGTLLEHANRLDELSALLDQAAAAGVPDEALAYLRALSLQRQGRIEEALVCAETMSEDVDAVRKAQLIGRLSDRLGQAERAFSAFSRMNRLESAAHPDAGLAARGFRRDLETMTKLLTPNFCAGWAERAPPPDRPSPVFLVGFPRSGTTLLDTILMGHSGLQVLEEEPLLERAAEALGGQDRLDRLTEDEVAQLRRTYFDALDSLGPVDPDRLVVDKLPLNIVLTPLIHRLFPAARLIFAQRHPCDVVLSCFMQSFKINPAMASFLDLDDTARLYDLVLGFWERCRQILPLRVHTVRYEGLIGDAEEEIASLMTFLELPWEDRLLEHSQTAHLRGHIKTPSYAQVSEPIYSRAVGRWERYRAQMEEVLPVLDPWIRRLGYPPPGPDRPAELPVSD